MNWIVKYNTEIQSGKIITSTRVKKVYARLCDDIKDRKSQWIYDDVKATRAVNFIEAFCKQSKGEWIGKNIVLGLFQKAFIASLFGVVHRLADCCIKWCHRRHLRQVKEGRGSQNYAKWSDRIRS